MRKISAMYQWSGGTDYRHTCYECNNCIRVAVGKMMVHKCNSYGNTGSTATDWKPSFIACKHFNQPPPDVPVFKGQKTNTQKENVMDGQISIFEFMEE